MPNLYGIHDSEGAHLVPTGGWCVALVSLSENYQPVDYKAIRPDVNWLVRLSWGYGATGTIPLPNNLTEYLMRLSSFVAGSRGVHTYIIGNEPNHENERPNGVFITPQMYSEVFLKAFNLIKGVKSTHRVAPAGLAPYHANPLDWTLYAKQMLLSIAEHAMPDSLVCHAYSRSEYPDSITDETRMQPPLQETYSGFLTFLDFLDSVPQVMRHLPVDITEFDENLPDGWLDANTGIVRKAYTYLDSYNRESGGQKIRSLSLYRYPSYDKWGFKDKGGVIQDFSEATAMGLQSPQEGLEGTKEVILMPSIKSGGKTSPEPSTSFERILDPRVLDRGVNFTSVDADSGQTVWKVREIRWLNVAESQGRHHIYFDTLDEEGKRLIGVRIKVRWPSGNFDVVSEAKPGEPYSANYPMSSSRNDYSAQVTGDGLSETVSGVGMGSDGGSGFNASNHTSTVVVWQRTRGKLKEETVEKPSEESKISLVHPVRQPIFRKITQGFGEAGIDYSRFSVDGVPLRGHNGLDFATPVGSDVQAVDSGRVVEVAFDEEGYGNYVKIVHLWGESLYAHLSKTYTDIGMLVMRGQIIGLSGASGNATGPHLHFALRVNPYNRKDGWGGYSDPKTFLPLTSSPTVPVEKLQVPVLQAIKTAATEFGLEWQLIASMAWAESSFRSNIPDGLLQIGSATWSDNAHLIGATDINNTLDNARVGTFYMKNLLNTLHGDLDQALIAYNFGIGNVLAKIPPPVITLEYVNKVKHGRDLLKAVGA